MVVPDGQPVRWALNRFFDCNLKDRVYGPRLTCSVLAEAQKFNLGVFLYGSTQRTLDGFSEFISSRYPGVEICGIQKDRFREATADEDEKDMDKIRESGAHIVLVGRGCPRQEWWVADHLHRLDAALLAVGAAFDLLAGAVRQAPPWMQSRGLEWLYRLSREPKRLWKRYLFTNSYFLFLCLKHKLSEW
jgi:exopolysaccharide biosynthesis WecB/TagA/CpsF family protein